MFSLSNSTKEPGLINADKIIICIGLIAILLPFVIQIGFDKTQCIDGTMNSISAYYHTESRDLLMGLVCTLGFSFLAYNGHHEIDMILSKIAALCALCVAFIPTSIFEGEYAMSCIMADGSKLREYIHVACAALLLIVMGIFSIFIFTHREERDEIHPRKLFFYRFYGAVIFIALLLIALYFYFDLGSSFKHWNVKPIFLLETICLIAFGCSWLLKSGLFDSKKTA